MLTTAVVSCLLLLNLCACTSGEKAATGTASTTSVAGMQGKFDKDRTIKILPETPTVATDLQVIYSGIENATFQWEKNGALLKGENGERLSRQQFAKDDVVTVKATAGAKTSSASAVIANIRPKVTAVTLGTQTIFRGTDITATPVGYDADGDYVRFNYRWLINGQDMSERDATLRGDKFKRGDVVGLEVAAADMEGEGEVSRMVPLLIPNAPPKFVSLILVESSSDTYIYAVRADDPDGDTITYSLTNPPKGMSVDASSGKITWKITAIEDAGKREVEIVAQDEMGLKTAQKFVMEVTIP